MKYLLKFVQFRNDGHTFLNTAKYLYQNSLIHNLAKRVKQNGKIVLQNGIYFQNVLNYVSYLEIFDHVKKKLIMLIHVLDNVLRFAVYISW